MLLETIKFTFVLQYFFIFFSFWYHMFGESVDTLNMYMESSQSSSRLLIWSLAGHQINKWQRAQYTLQSYNPTRLWIEGTAGADYSGDIALDDFSLLYGECKPDVSLLHIGFNFRGGLKKGGLVLN